jgi:hypothetical protein
MRVLRVSLNPANVGAKVPDYGALEAGLMRWMQPGTVLEIDSERHQPDTLETIRKAVRNGTLVPADADTAKAAGVPWKAPKHESKSPMKAEG